MQQKTLTVTSEKGYSVSWQFPFFHKITEKAPCKRGDMMWETTPSGLKLACTVAAVEWVDTLPNPVTKQDGDWVIRVGYYPIIEGKQDTTQVWYSETHMRALEFAA